MSGVGTVIIDLAVADENSTARGYARLLGLSPAAGGSDRAGTAFDIGDVTLRVRRDVPEHRVLFGVDGPEATDGDPAVRLAQRRGLTLNPARDGEWAAADLPVGLCITDATRAGGQRTGVGITGVDHVVFQAADRDRAVALFGATLGLDFRLDRQISADVRQLFFRTPGPVVEVIVTPGQDDDSAADLSVWGIAWATAAIDRTRERLAAEGVTVSDVRNGFKPGTRVMTVRDPVLATRTILIESEAARAAGTSTSSR